MWMNLNSSWCYLNKVAWITVQRTLDNVCLCLLRNAIKIIVIESVCNMERWTWHAWRQNKDTEVLLSHLVPYAVCMWKTGTTYFSPTCYTVSHTVILYTLYTGYYQVPLKHNPRNLMQVTDLWVWKIMQNTIIIIAIILCFINNCEVGSEKSSIVFNS